MPPRFPQPKDPKVNLHSGIFYTEAGAYLAAVSSLRRCLEFDPGNCRALYYLALAYFRLERTKESVQVYNQLSRSSDPEARPACAMLARAFALQDGHPLHDVRAFDENDALEILEQISDHEIAPTKFARMVWATDTGWDDAILLDIGITVGPNRQFLGLVPTSDSILEIDPDCEWIPHWSCPMSVFDRRAAEYLFFLRALYDWKHRVRLPSPPDICETWFTPWYQGLLLNRIYPPSK